MEKITKSVKYQKVIDILNTIEGDEIAMLVEFLQSEQTALARKAAKAKEKAAEKKVEIDELGNAVLKALTADPMTRDQVFECVANFDDEVSVAKVGARLSKLVDLGYAEKAETKAVSASGKKTTRMVYSLATLTAVTED